MTEVLEMELGKRLNRDLKRAVATMGRAEVRFLVDYYYQLQEMRKSSHNQVRSTMLPTPSEPNEILGWFAVQTEQTEAQIKKALEWYVDGSRLGRWVVSNYGLGPVIAAGLLAHISLTPWRCRTQDKEAKHCKRGAPCTALCGEERVNTAGQIWSFAGISVGQEWLPKTKRPWNADLKTLCWKIGQSFLKFHNQPECYYGQLFKKRWEIEKERNERFLFKDQAAAKLVKFKIGKNTDAYKAYSIGKLPPAHILQRACRWATKMFLSHYLEVAHEIEFGVKPPKPFVIEHLGHTEILSPPNWPMAE